MANGTGFPACDHVFSTCNRMKPIIKVEGVDTDFRFVARDSDLEYTLKEITAGSTFSTYVIAANEGGEAAPSPTVTKVVGA
jgi:hypothetical protein